MDLAADIGNKKKTSQVHIMLETVRGVSPAHYALRKLSDGCQQDPPRSQRAALAGSLENFGRSRSLLSQHRFRGLVCGLDGSRGAHLAKYWTLSHSSSTCRAARIEKALLCMPRRPTCMMAIAICSQEALFSEPAAGGDLLSCESCVRLFGLGLLSKSMLTVTSTGYPLFSIPSLCYAFGYTAQMKCCPSSVLRLFLLLSISCSLVTKAAEHRFGGS